MILWQLTIKKDRILLCTVRFYRSLLLIFYPSKTFEFTVFNCINGERYTTVQNTRYFYSNLLQCITENIKTCGTNRPNQCKHPLNGYSKLCF